MAGTIKKMIDSLIAQRAKGDEVLMKITKVKFVLKGINPDSFTAASPDDPAVIQKIRQLAIELNVAL